MKSVRFLVLGILVTLPALGACSRTEVVRRPHEGHLITCDAGMKGCVGRAEKLCGDKGFTIVSGSSFTRMLGGESSSYRQATEVGSLEVRCGLIEIEEADSCRELPARTDASEPVAPASEQTAGAPMRVCVPGATQRCVGAGACDGGQVCLADGLAFGNCDCGSSTPAAPARSINPAPAVGPAAPSPAAPPTVPGAMPAPTPLAQ